jgi:hypothetical protein
MGQGVNDKSSPLGKSTYQGNDIVEHMCLTNGHSRKAQMVGIDDMYVKVICGRYTRAVRSRRGEVG